MYEKDYGIFWRALQPVLVVIPIILFCAFLADGFSAPIQSVLGATTKEIQDSSNVSFLRSNIYWIPIGILAIYILCFIMLSYLENYHPDDDGMIPYKRDLNGNKIRKTFIKHPYIDECYKTYDDFFQR